MSIDQLDELLSLPLPARMDLAQALWQSINETVETSADVEERDAIATAQRRDKEMCSVEVRGRTHKQVIAAARRAPC
jgi:hypothetical protein